jgi:hypothetical protein
MADSFTIHFSVGGIPKEADCTLRVSTYTYQFLCRVSGSDLIIEKDDEGTLRVLEVDPGNSKNSKPEPSLVKALIEEMERILH